jgi:hypothetical protein
MGKVDQGRKESVSRRLSVIAPIMHMATDRRNLEWWLRLSNTHDVFSNSIVSHTAAELGLCIA